jgi:hypothetical protein
MGLNVEPHPMRDARDTGGAGNGIRTRDPQLGRLALYR